MLHPPCTVNKVYNAPSFIRSKTNRLLTFTDRRVTFTERELASIARAGASKLYEEDRLSREDRSATAKQEGQSDTAGEELRGDNRGVQVVSSVRNQVRGSNIQTLHAEPAYRKFDPLTSLRVAHDARLTCVYN
ncbi:hypothetical protein SAMN05216323_10675 [Williamwhitmania taraxaci]|uniref:Uncharacterized protein n=1 Tax=Williamwhitmania taraxaci TaxID=1640674 RepID=A0A1G6QXL2_9BACT|nr:hypothetical protein SAMN05216323_10675 [Williamwhitmania taraxaci]